MCGELVMGGEFPFKGGISRGLHSLEISLDADAFSALALEPDPAKQKPKPWPTSKNSETQGRLLAAAR
jgi:hypothetical protein